MKASELIAALQKAIAGHGDLNVSFRCITDSDYLEDVYVRGDDVVIHGDGTWNFDTPGWQSDSD